MKLPDPTEYEKQRERDKAETERLKVLWDKENAVDKGTRREAAAKAAAEKEARETPSPEDQAKGKEIFDKVYNHWHRQDVTPKHRLLLAEDNQTILKHVFTLGITHPFRKSAWEHTITLPADKFGKDKRWCVLTVDLDLHREWTTLLEQEAQDQRRHLDLIKTELAEHEKDQDS